MAIATLIVCWIGVVFYFGIIALTMLLFGRYM